MDDDKKRLVVAPGNPSLPESRGRQVSMPHLNPGNSQWPTQLGRYARNTAIVQADAKYMRARADQVAAATELAQKFEEWIVTHSRLSWVGERCEHEHLKGRLSMRNEIACMLLEHELQQTNLRTQVAASSYQLAQYGAPPERSEPAPAPPPIPPGLSVEDVEAVLHNMPDVKPEIAQMLMLALRGSLAEKKRS